MSKIGVPTCLDKRVLSEWTEKGLCTQSLDLSVLTTIYNVLPSKMAAINIGLGAPKRWPLNKKASITDFENWKQNQIYTLTREPRFAPFLLDGTTWEKKKNNNPERGFAPDAGHDANPPTGLTAAQKVTNLEIMLNQVANYCVHIAPNTIVKGSTSMRSVWQAIRLHHGFQTTGGRFLDFDDITLGNDESPEDLYQRLIAFVDDNLLTRDGGITHCGEAPAQDEDLSPTVDNIIVLKWLKLVHPGLPHLVKQRYGTELRSSTLASIKPEISLALTSLLSELEAGEEAKVMRSAYNPRQNTNTNTRAPGSRFSKPKTRKPKSCALCTEAKRPNNHYLSSCKYLPEEDRKYMSKVRQLSDIASMYIDEDSIDEDDDDQDNTKVYPAISARRVNIKQSPHFKAFYRHYPLRVILDTGAETNMIRAHTARYMGINITKTNQSALQADGMTPLTVVGETHITLTRNNIPLTLDALVIEDLDEDVLAGMPFLTSNDIAIHPAKCQITIGGNEVVQYGGTKKTSPHHSVRRAHAEILRAPTINTTLWPGDFIELEVPDVYSPDTALAVEPRTISATNQFTKPTTVWPSPYITEAVAGKIRLINSSSEPRFLRKNEQFCQVRPVTHIPDIDPTHDTVTIPSPKSLSCNSYSQAVTLDPDSQLNVDQRNAFTGILKEYDHVFSPEIPGYNGAVGPYKAVVNMGPVQPPQRKGRVPQYARDKLTELQSKFDELEKLGVFQKPESAGVSVEYVNPSFLIKKSSGGFRLVTAFADVGRYCKPQPSLMPDVDSTLRTIARWKYIVVTDLSNAFYQIPLESSSMKYCGVATPFRGVRVYTRCAMGMPGSETALEELMCRVLGDLLQRGVAAKLADDLYCGGDTPQELADNWRELLQALHRCDLHLSPKKTVICPKTTTILGWIWSQGSLHASPHRISTLVLCQLPNTVRAMRSFIGAYKVLARVIKDCANILSPLENAIAGQQSGDKIEWTEDLSLCFRQAQQALNTNESIVLPRPQDQLWIITDGSVKQHGIGATLYVTRKGKPKLAGFFSAKLKKHQVSWLPCEIEALGIAAAIKHYSPFIIQSAHTTCLLTDSKPCVQAVDKLCRGEFSSSPRITSFLSIVSRYQIIVRHLAGSANIPSDFASRNAPDCPNTQCQICSFINKIEQCVVQRASTQDIIKGSATVPFASRIAWMSTQAEDPDLRRVCAHYTTIKKAH